MSPEFPGIIWHVPGEGFWDPLNCDFHGPAREPISGFEPKQGRNNAAIALGISLGWISVPRCSEVVMSRLSVIGDYRLSIMAVNAGSMSSLFLAVRPWCTFLRCRALSQPRWLDVSDVRMQEGCSFTKTGEKQPKNRILGPPPPKKIAKK